MHINLAGCDVFCLQGQAVMQHEHYSDQCCAVLSVALCELTFEHMMLRLAQM